MMGMRMPETCWAVFKRQVINLRICCIWLVDSVGSMMMHGLANPKFKLTVWMTASQSLTFLIASAVVFTNILFVLYSSCWYCCRQCCVSETIRCFVSQARPRSCSKRNQQTERRISSPRFCQNECVKTQSATADDGICGFRPLYGRTDDYRNLSLSW